MTFLEALTELKEGRCGGIRAADSNHVIQLKPDGTIDYTIYRIETFLKDFILVNPKPTYTEVEKEYYIIVDKDGNTLATNSKPFNGKLPENISQVKLTGTFKHQVARKVMKRVRLDVLNGGVSIHDVPKNAKIYAEWEEDEAAK